MVLYLSTTSLPMSHFLWVQPEYTWSKKDVGSPNAYALRAPHRLITIRLLNPPGHRLLCWVPSTSDQDCVSFQPILCHPHTQIRIILFHDEQWDILNLEFSPSHVSIGFSQIAFPKTVLLKDDRADSVQEERLGLPYWTMILAICVVVDESKCLDTPISEFSTICEHLPCSLECTPILRLLLVHRNQAIWRWYPHDLSRCHLRCWWSVQWLLRKIQNCLLQHHRGAQLDLCIFGALPPIQHFSDDIVH